MEPGACNDGNRLSAMGTNSIVMWLNNKQAYKVKYHALNKFTMQMLSEEDIKKKFGFGGKMK